METVRILEEALDAQGVDSMKTQSYFCTAHVAELVDLSIYQKDLTAISFSITVFLWILKRRAYTFCFIFILLMLCGLCR